MMNIGTLFKKYYLHYTLIELLCWALYLSIAWLSIIYFSYIPIHMLNPIILPYYLSLFLLKYTHTFQQPSQDFDTEKFNWMTVMHGTWCVHTLLVGFHIKSWGFISITYWNCTLVKSDAFSLLECAHWKFLKVILLSVHTVS